MHNSCDTEAPAKPPEPRKGSSIILRNAGILQSECDLVHPVLIDEVEPTFDDDQPAQHAPRRCAAEENRECVIEPHASRVYSASIAISYWLREQFRGGGQNLCLGERVHATALGNVSATH